MAVKRLTLKEETVDYAIKKGLEQLGLAQEQALIHVIQREAQSLFGYREAVVSITYDEKDSENALNERRTEEFRAKFNFRFHEGLAQVQVPASFYDDRYVATPEEREEYLREFLNENGVEEPSDESIKRIVNDFTQQYDYVTVWELTCHPLNKAGAKIHLKVDEDKMRAQAIIFPKGLVTPEDIYKVLKKQGIIRGILSSNIEAVLKNRYIGYFDIARGRAAVDDQPGVVEKFFTEDEHKEFAKMMELLHIDTRSVKEINITDRNQLLMRIGDIIRGEDGYTIEGIALKRVELSKEEAGVKGGENVYFSDDGKQIFSKISGHIKWRPQDKMIDVEPVYIVDGNVDFKEGNIIGFVGKVIIKGDVKPKFTVIADGDVEIHGSVEEATVRSSNGNVLIAGSVVHHSEGIVQAKETAQINIATNARVKAERILIEKEAINSRLTAEKSIEATGAPGTIIGGCLEANELIRVNTIGSESEVATDVRAGDVSELKKRLKGLSQKLSKKTTQLKEAKQVSRLLKNRREQQELTHSQKVQLERTEEEIPQLEDALAFGAEEEAKIKRQIAERREARLEVVKTLHANVDVRIFEAYFIPENAEQFTGFHCETGRVARYPL